MSKSEIVKPVKHSVTVSFDSDDISLSASQLATKMGLQRATSGTIIPNIDNVQRSLYFWHGKIAFDEFHQRVFKQDGTEWEYADTLNFTTQLQRECGLTRISPSIVDQGIDAYAFLNKQNEPKDYFESLQWDKKPRIKNFFQDYVGAKNTDYAQAVSKNFWLTMVARVYHPGCQVDNMVVLEGKQGIYKSSLFETIGGKFYSCVIADLGNKDFLESMQGKFIFEFAELHRMHSKDLNYVKGMITNRTDRYRVAYGRRSKDYPRQLVICGTTNDHVYLLDDENRRQWPIKTNDQPINIKRLAEARDQLFAEAVHVYKSEPDDRDRKESCWWKVPISALAEQEARRQIDPWEPVIQSYIRLRQEVETHQILTDCLKMDVAKLSRYDNIRVGKILRLFQWDRVQIREGFESRWVYRRPGTPLDLSDVMPDWEN